jgi:hypothetical protein
VPFQHTRAAQDGPVAQQSAVAISLRRWKRCMRAVMEQFLHETNDKAPQVPDKSSLIAGLRGQDEFSSRKTVFIVLIMIEQF